MEKQHPDVSGHCDRLRFYAFGLGGNLGYDFLETQGTSFLSGVKSLFAGGTLDSSSTSVNSVIGLLTNGGNYAAVIVTADTGVAITLQFVTFGASEPSGPYVTQVMNNYSLIPQGLPNSGIAPGSLFIVK
jgi:hypothetical protein